MIAEISRGDFMEIGTRLARLRKEKGLTQAELAEQLFVSSKTVSKWENGYGYPDIESLPRIAAALGVDTDFLPTGKTKLVSAPEKKREAEAPERDEEKKGVFRLYLWQATLNNFSFWIILLSVFSLLLAIIGGPLDFRTEDIPFSCWKSRGRNTACFSEGRRVWRAMSQTTNSIFTSTDLLPLREFLN